MAETKRNSVAGKVATPKAAGNQKDMIDWNDILHKCVEARVKIIVAPHNVAYEGSVFALSLELNVLALNTASHPALAPPHGSVAQGHFHIFPIYRILSIDILSKNNGVLDPFQTVQPSIERLDLISLKQREDMAVRKLKEKEAQKGRGVGKEGQDIFDALARTLPCRWHETTIVANESVMIRPPYRVEDIQAPKDKQPSLVHVRKIMEGYLARKGKAAPGNAHRPAVATPIPPRKGG